MTTAAARRDSRRLNQAVGLVLRRYGRQIKRRPSISLPALLLPGIGDVLIFYAPPLVVAQLLGAVARGDALTIGMFTPYVLTFTALWFAGEVVWRGAEALIARAEISGIQSLYVEAMDELLAKDLAFFHDNFAGSLTKRTLGYARRFEDVFDVLSFQVIAKIVPLGFVTVVLWRYSPLLILVLLGMLSITVALVVPRIRHRRQLVDEREAASNVLAGHVADSIANAEAVRAFARERDEAAMRLSLCAEYFLPAEMKLVVNASYRAVPTASGSRYELDAYSMMDVALPKSAADLSVAQVAAQFQNGSGNHLDAFLQTVKARLESES